MDYETKLYLDNLIEAIKSPDWAIIGLTVVNIVFMIWLGFRQNRLQKQQKSIQAYEIYKPIYELLKSVNKCSHELLFRFARYVMDDRTNPFYESYWQKQLLEIKHLKAEVESQSNNMELLLPKTLYNKLEYVDILDFMCFLVSEFDALITDNEISTHIKIDKEKQIVYGEAYLIEIIISQIRSDEKATRFKQQLQAFLAKKNALHTSALLREIENRCRID